MAASRKVLKAFEDPISLEIMDDPVILLETKQTYDRGTLLQHFATQVQSRIPKTCPKTGLVLKNQNPEKELIPNYSLRDAIEEWKLTIKESEEAERKAELERKAEAERKSQPDKADSKRGDASPFALFNQSGSQEATDRQNFEKLKEYKITAEKFKELKSILPEFLQFVAFGKQAEAENLLKKNPELLLMKDPVTDYSGRQFEPLTGYQLATWALDWRMRDMFLKYLDPLDKKEPDRQFNEVKTQGVVYKIAASALRVKQFDDQGKEIKSESKADDAKEITVRESQFNMVSFLDTLKTYVDNFNKWSNEKCVAYWCQVVGGSQRLFPAYLAQEYCQPNRPFYPVPNFSKADFVRSLDFYNWITNSVVAWFPSADDSKLGTDFGILRGGNGSEASGCGWGGGARHLSLASLDLGALTALYNVLLQKFPGLKQQPQPADEFAKEKKSSLNP